MSRLKVLFLNVFKVKRFRCNSVKNVLFHNLYRAHNLSSIYGHVVFGNDRQVISEKYERRLSQHYTKNDIKWHVMRLEKTIQNDQVNQSVQCF